MNSKNTATPDRINIFCNLRSVRHFVGVLVQKNKSILFEYDHDFLESEIHLSPFKLPLRRGVFEDEKRTFEGLFGLFNDSLPDGWGLLLLDRSLRAQGVPLNSITPFHRLATVGAGGMGSLEYEVAGQGDSVIVPEVLNLDVLSEEAKKILDEEGFTLDQVQSFLRLGGSSGGARPKIVTDLSAQSKILPCGTGSSGDVQLLIKFPAAHDKRDHGLVEYVYSLMAREAGVIMPETYLFPSETTDGFFAAERFDRDNGEKVHVHTACGLLHADHRHGSLDYESLIKLAKVLTTDVKAVEQMVRLMVFNVKAGNQDDHSKNFSFLLDEQGKWAMAPAYDLTPSSGPGGEHTATLNGKGKAITDTDLMAAASVADVPASFVRETIERTECALERFEELKQESRFIVKESAPRVASQSRIKMESVA
jgi:serine/threonine-protein kinase HipA